MTDREEGLLHPKEMGEGGEVRVGPLRRADGIKAVLPKEPSRDSRSWGGYVLLVWRRKWHSEHTPCAPALGQALCQGLHKQLRRSAQQARGRWTYQIPFYR